MVEKYIIQNSGRHRAVHFLVKYVYAMYVRGIELMKDEFDLHRRRKKMRSIIYIIGLIVVIAAVLSLIGLI